jgi:hypothetical protein
MYIIIFISLYIYIIHNIYICIFPTNPSNWIYKPTQLTMGPHQALYPNFTIVVLFFAPQLLMLDVFGYLGMVKGYPI